MANSIRQFIKRQNETLDIETIEVCMSGLPPALAGFRIAVLSDLHMRRPTPFHSAVLQAVRAIRPEFIVIVGDTIDEKVEPVAALMPFFALLGRIAPTVAVLGNNDCLPAFVDSLRRMYWRAGITLLENETRLLSARGFPLQVTGLMDPEAQKRGIQPVRDVGEQTYVPLRDALTPGENKTEGLSIPSILLLHQPQLFAHYASLKPSLGIAGHAHGGQVRLRNVGLYAPNQGFFPKLTSGLYTVGGAQLVVSRGIGNHLFPELRLNNPPHIPVIVFKPE